MTEGCYGDRQGVAIVFGQSGIVHAAQQPRQRQFEIFSLGLFEQIDAGALGSECPEPICGNRLPARARTPSLPSMDFLEINKSASTLAVGFSDRSAVSGCGAAPGLVYEDKNEGLTHLFEGMTPRFSGRGSHAAMPVLSTGYRPLASCPAQRAGAQRLCAMVLTGSVGLYANTSVVGG
jgi:hypothetical protein